MKQKSFIIYGLLCLSILMSCKKAEGPSHPALKDPTNRTVLMYLFQDTNLWAELTSNINDLEFGWDPTINGTMLVYVDASTRLTQFDGKPVLLEIQHDTTKLIVSKVVKVYEDADATNTNVFRQAQEDAIAMYPAASYGLILSGHGDGFFVTPPASKGLSGSDRWSQNRLDIDVIASNLLTHYDFMIFDACLMGETTSLYQLRKGTDFVVASVELSPGDGFAFHDELKSLFAQPKAELYRLVDGTNEYYSSTQKGRMAIDPDSYQTIGVYRMSAMDKLAAVTKKATEAINLSYNDLQNELMNIVGDPAMGIENSMYYPQEGEYSNEANYHDLGLFRMLLQNINRNDLAVELDAAINAVVIQKQFAISDGFRQANPQYDRLSANMSFYIPKPLNPESRVQDEAFYNRFEWSAASGFTNKWK